MPFPASPSSLFHGGGSPSEEDSRARIEEITHWRKLRALPSMELRLASSHHPIWRDAGALDQLGSMPMPYWAIAWAGGLAIARYLLDHPDVVRGRRVVDFAAGAGLGAIAAAQAGASHVTATEIDPYAAAVVRLNAERNRVAVEVALEDWLERGVPDADVILAGDVCYEQDTAHRVRDWLARCRDAGCLVLLGDPGRAWMPKEGFTPVARFRFEPESWLDDDTARRATVWRMDASSPSSGPST